MRDITMLVLLLVPLGSVAESTYYSNTNEVKLCTDVMTLVLYSVDEGLCGRNILQSVLID